MQTPEIIREKVLEELRGQLETRDLEITQEYQAKCAVGTEVTRNDTVDTCRDRLLKDAQRDKAQFIYFHPWTERTFGYLSGRVTTRATILLQKE